jgi:dihydrofolate synthase/folylpolyglutamate synthase
MPEPDLDRMRALMEFLDHPEALFPAIQVTGTNGKTTATRIAAAVACAHGLSTGVFVSPHVLSVTERLSLCADPIGEQEFADEYERLGPYFDLVDVRVGRVTYFEALTALAFAWFADKPAGLGVLEVGMGGRWDATNVARGEVAVVCPVGLDHVGILGDTVEEIAAEKAGIIKPGGTAVLREQRPEAMAVLRARAEEVGAPILLEGKDFGVEWRTPAVGGQAITLRGVHATYPDLALPLFGDAAARGAAAAIVACETLLDRSLDSSAVRAALASVVVPGRMEVVGRRPLVVLDGAHNPDAAAAVVAALRESFSWRRLLVVAAMFGDKDVEAVAGTIGSLADAAFAAAPASPRAAPVARVADALAAAGVEDVGRFASVAEAVDAAGAAAEEEDLILVTGSFYTVAEARPRFVGPADARTRRRADPASDSTEEGPTT